MCEAIVKKNEIKEKDIIKLLGKQDKKQAKTVYTALNKAFKR